jgi:hypothetical protein
MPDSPELLREAAQAVRGMRRPLRQVFSLSGKLFVCAWT